MDPNPLRGFMALAEQLNYPGAARTLGTQPGVLSEMVAALERQMGVLLIAVSTNTRKVQLTRAGETLKSLASEFLETHATLTRRVKAAGMPLLRVSVSEAMSMVEVRARLHQKQQPSDQWTFTLIRMLLAKQRVELQQGKFDVGLSQTARSNEDEHLVVEPIWREPLVALAFKDHLPWGREQQIYPSMLASHPLIVARVKQGEGYGGQITDLLQSHGIESLDSLEKLSTPGEVLLAVLDKRGVGLVGATQWANSGPVANTAAYQVVDENTGEPLWLTTYLRRPVTINPALTEAMAQFTARLKTDDVHPLVKLNAANGKIAMRAVESETQS